MTGNENALRRALRSPFSRSLRKAATAAGLSITSWLIGLSALSCWLQRERQRHPGRSPSQKLARAGSAEFPRGESPRRVIVHPPAARLSQVLPSGWALESPIAPVPDRADAAWTRRKSARRILR